MTYLYIVYLYVAMLSNYFPLYIVYFAELYLLIETEFLGLETLINSRKDFQCHIISFYEIMISNMDRTWKKKKEKNIPLWLLLVRIGNSILQ